MHFQPYILRLLRNSAKFRSKNQVVLTRQVLRPHLPHCWEQFELQMDIFGLLSLGCFLLHSCTTRCEARGKLLEKTGSSLSLSLFVREAQSTGDLDLTFFFLWLSKMSVLKGWKLFGASLEANEQFLWFNSSGYFLLGATWVKAQW